MIKGFNVLVFILFLNNQINSQINSQVNSQVKSSRYSFNLYYQPSFAYRYSNMDFKDEVLKYGYQIGFGINYFITPKIELGSGILFQNKGYKYSSKLVFPENSDDIMVLNVDRIDNFFNFNFVSIPLILKFNKQLTPKISFGLFLGVSGDLFLYRTETLKLFKDNSVTDERTEYFKSNSNTRDINMSGIFGLNFEYFIFDKYALFLQPNYDYSFYSFYKKDLIFNSKFRDFGLKIGIVKLI